MVQTSGTPLIVKLLAGNQDESWTQDEVYDAVHWWKQLVAFIIGAVFGMVPYTGLLALGLFGAIFVFTSIIFYKSHLKIDEEEFGGHGELLNDGLGFHLGMFMLSW
eukprot:CAMPEP_0202891556 /NCGR_PEP_ID=MMETSP1392-20130828/1588_1 /ASSEMBLY_ACC=CAM_ASM_000868 /TAXON_ID=225041 /ORGANISM="Chlamydomonas chlamydogama, Strain SAG 11-48b" /LENGTH=105 /DNA_ID=CAMNT_0049575345 /DNA_START=45 /DNA_END=359 /DNA_ORIENTATION=+